MRGGTSLTAVALGAMVITVGLRSADAQHGMMPPGAGSPSPYPGLLHVLELKDRLKLTAEQEAKAQTMLTAMFAESRPKSARLLGAEAKLRQLFASGQADEAAVRAAATEVEKARTEERLVQLMFDLKTRDLLSDEQRRLYHEARWGAHRPMGPHGGGPHGAGAPMK